MRSTTFDATVNFYLPLRDGVINKPFLFDGKKVSVSFSFYERVNPDEKEHFIFAATKRPEDFRWGDGFEVLNPDPPGVLGKGKVLLPAAQRTAGEKDVEKRKFLLRRLSGNEYEMLKALVDEKGVRGIGEKEIFELTPLSIRNAIELSQKLEAEGQIRILSFSPLLLLSQSGFEFLCDKILVFLRSFHKAHPNERGIQADALKKKFALHSRIYSLALKHLLREGKVREAEGRLALSSFRLALTPEEEALLAKMEEMCLEGKLESVSMEELQKRFHLSVKRLENLLYFLIERRKIVKGKDGFILHSQWLDELSARIRSSGKSELSVGDFKEMTGLSRKYAIPLLELLDQMGITRRRGPTREILK